jgi:ribosomal protein L1
MMDFINPFNEETKDRMGQSLTVHITIFDDRSMAWRVVGTPTDELIMSALKVDKGSGEPNKTKLEKKLSQSQLTEIAEAKAADMNTDDVESIKKMVAGTGKNVRVATVATDAEAEKLFAKLDKENIDFDILIAAPDMMPKLGKYARLLGPRGLMPNPKSGTVTTDVAKAAEEAKAGKVEYRVDQAGIIHLSIGKASFGPAKLTDNAEAVLSSVRAAKPASLKGIYLKSAYLSSTMGPSIKLEL